MNTKWQVPAVWLLCILCSSLFFAASEVEPPFVAKIKSWAKKVYVNKNGYWEAEFKYGIAMVYIPAGEFLMGSPAGEIGREADEGPLHRVFLDGYWMAKYEVTQGLWTAIMKKNPSHFKNAGKNAPVENVTHYEVQTFITHLNQQAGLFFRVPTEAQWEKACRAGSNRFIYGSWPLEEIAWFFSNSKKKTHPVGEKKPNAYGLYDMLGNVWEWTSDWHGEDYYSHSPLKNPTGPITGSRLVTRGGSFSHERSYLRCAHRNSCEPAACLFRLGFRLLLPEI